MNPVLVVKAGAGDMWPLPKLAAELLVLAVLVGDQPTVSMRASEIAERAQIERRGELRARLRLNDRAPAQLLEATKQACRRLAAIGALSQSVLPEDRRIPTYKLTPEGRRYAEQHPLLQGGAA